MIWGLKPKISILEGEAEKKLEKLIGLQYNMADCKAIATETQEGFDLAES
jgi:hypothetical protein